MEHSSFPDEQADVPSGEIHLRTLIGRQVADLDLNGYGDAPSLHVVFGDDGLTARAEDDGEGMLVVKNEHPSEEGVPTARSHGPMQAATQLFSMGSAPKQGSQVSPMSVSQALGSHSRPVAVQVSRYHYSRRPSDQLHHAFKPNTCNNAEDCATSEGA